MNWAFPLRGSTMALVGLKLALRWIQEASQRPHNNTVKRIKSV